MAYDYNKAKQAWDMMDDNQKKQYTEQNKNDANFQQFAQQYHNETYGNGSSNTNGSNNQNNTVNNTQGTNTTTSNTNTSNSNNGSGTNGSYDPIYYRNQNTSTTGNTGNTGSSNQGGSPLSDGRNGDGNTYGKFVFDADEYLDKSKFGKSDGTGIQVKEGTAAQTGRPDYTAEDTNRLNEMIHNLNEYRNTNPSFFNDRETFNRVFEYNQRESQAQRDLLDSYWKKAQDYKKASSYTNSTSFSTDLDNGNISESEFEALKQYNQDVYIKWQQDMQNKLNSAIANLANPFSIDDMTTALNKIVEKFNLQAGDPYKIIEGWEDMMQKTGAWDSMKEAQKQYTDADATIAKIKNIQKAYSGSTSALSSARMNKALEPYISLLSNQLASGQHWQQLYQTQLGTANDYANTIVKQANEDQRIFNNKLSSLGFAMQAYSYRTPEQQAQLQLQTQAIENDMNLLNQSKLNDLSLYNQYATAKLQNQLNYEMQDLTVSDPKQLRANLSNVLDQYYDTYGSMIQRSKDQVINDVLNYAKQNGVSVGQALSENFIKPLQSKPQYQALLNKSTGYDPYQNQQSWTYSVDGNGDVSYSIKGYGTLPSNLSRGERRNIYSDIFNQSGNDASWSALGMSTAINDGSYTGWCGAFVNDWLVSMGEQGIFGDSLESKTKYATESEPVVGSVFVMDSPTRGENGHVGIVTGINSDGTLEVVDSNWTGDKTKQAHTLDPNKYHIYGYYYPKSLKIQESGYYDPNLTDFFGKSSASFSSTQWNAIKDAGYTTQEYNKMKSNYAAEVGKKITDNENLLLTDMYKLKNMGKAGYTAFQYGLGRFPGTKIADYNSWYNTITASAALKNLVDLKGEGATFGALSDNELAFITDSSKIFNKDQTYDEFMTNLNKTISDLEAGIKARGGKVDLTANAKNSSEYAQYLFPTVQISNNNTGLSSGGSFILNGNK